MIAQTQTIEYHGMELCQQTVRGQMLSSIGSVIAFISGMDYCPQTTCLFPWLRIQVAQRSHCLLCNGMDYRAKGPLA